MLIFTRVRAPEKQTKGTKKKATKYLLVLFIVSFVSACADRDGSKQAALQGSASTAEGSVTKLEGPSDQSISKLPTDEVTSNLLESGFYEEQTEPIENEEKHQRSGDDTTISSEESAPKDLIKRNPDSKSLVEDLGFSEAQQDQEALTDNGQTELFCLDTNNTPQSRESIEEACQKISSRLASVKYTACEAAQLQLTGCASVKGFPILMSEFLPVKERKPQGRILIIGGTHGDELTSVSMIIRWIQKLNRHHTGLFHWHLVPMMNPDGVLKRGATRTNNNGVDLNRNMPSDDWERNAIKYWVEKGGKDPRKYPGEEASSEPETQWLIDEIESFKPDAIISVHAPYGVVDFDSLLLNTAPKSLGKLHLNLLGTYPGSLGNYAGINLNIPVITLELPHSWEMPSEKESTKIWEDIVSWLKKNVNTEIAKN